MTTRTRLFVGSALAVLLAGLGTGLLMSYSRMPALAQLGGRGPAELAYLPYDARLIAFANVRDVMDSDLRQKVLALRATRPAASVGDDLLDQAGIDIEIDVDRIAASLGGGQADAARDRALVVARGRFDPDLIEALIRQRGGHVTDYKGVRLLTHRYRDQDVGVAFVEADLVAVGSADAVRGAVDAKAGRLAALTSNADVMALVRDVDDGNAWAVGRFDAVAARARVPQVLANQLPPIDWIAATGRVGDAVRGVVRAEARDAAAADDLREVVRGFLAVARLQAPANPQLRALMHSLELGGSGTTVSLSFLLPPEAIDALAALRHPPPGT